MEPRTEPLRLYGQVSETPALAWEPVAAQLASAPTLWVVANAGRYPHPRPVWGVWDGEHLHCSIGTPRLRSTLVPGAPVTVHCDSGLDVVIVEGDVVGPTSDAAVIAAYDEKYQWQYDLATYGPLTTVVPRRVLAWRVAGPAGRDGFAATGRWTFAGG